MTDKPEHILFLTGKLAEKQLHQILQKMQPEFTYTVHQLGVKVAALMTTDMISRRLKDTFNADKIILPGRCRGDITALSAEFGLPIERGPEELKDFVIIVRKVDAFMGTNIKKPNLSELMTRNSLQKCLVAQCDIQKGELFSELNIVGKRTGGLGISPIYYQDLIGCIANKDYQTDEIIFNE